MASPTLSDLDLAKEKDRCLLGCAKVELKHLVFEETGGIGTRHVTKANVNWLIRKFEVDKCRRLEPQHWIPAVVTRNGLQVILNANSLSSIGGDDPGDFPLSLPSGHEVTCLQGRIRHAAGTKWLETDDQWWILKLYDSRLSSEARRSLREDRDASQEFSSGEIYWNVRHHERQGNDDERRKWLARWPSPYMERDFTQLRESIYSRPLYEALDRLLEFRALWPAFHVGNLHRLLPMRCPEALASYLDFIRDVWMWITDSRPWRLEETDVEHLEGRSPMWSKADGIYIDEVFKDGTVFCRIINQDEREVLRQRVRQCSTIIPSIRTFLEDSKYLEPMAKLVRMLLPPDFKGTVQEGMRRCYQPSANGVLHIQTSAAGHRTAPRDADDDGFWSAYRQVWLGAMRDWFGIVPGFRPRKMTKVPGTVAQPHPSILWSRFVDLAVSVGFNISKRPDFSESPEDIIRQCLSLLRPADLFEQDPDLLSAESRRVAENLGFRRRPAEIARPARPSLTTDLGAWSITARCGMTDGASFFSDQKYLFLDNIYARLDDVPGVHLTSFAVKRDFFLAHFPPAVDLIRQPCSSWSSPATMLACPANGPTCANIFPSQAHSPALPFSDMANEGEAPLLTASENRDVRPSSRGFLSLAHSSYSLHRQMLNLLPSLS
ncbi:predicted protein [Histoplasma mississippiense (nom. inval.)]|uniref:predicted protein n=1 Tax=Ajellomyces capsulatus (strain NAm1 / WU24) TaxID=2059318 RepID=UPI000157D4F6|nr:predicted protein [Histoplasma mississippiense (nom. inval.)]EDN05105.1 predicted protein [Histoplasma mississippiense (nom. inval.)]